jgi:hypothetical protein
MEQDMTKEALKLALEALTNAYWPTDSDLLPAHNVKECGEAITAIKEALANEALDKMAENARELGLDYEPEQPKVRTGNCLRVGICASEGHKIQPQRTWVTLTEDEIVLISADCAASHQHTDIHFARAIEAKLKERNS